MEVRLHSFLAMALDRGEWWSSCCSHFTPEKDCSVPTEQDSRWAEEVVWKVVTERKTVSYWTTPFQYVSLVNKMNFCFQFCCRRNDFLHFCVQNAVVLFCKALNHPTKWHAVTVDTATVSAVRYEMHSKHMLCLMTVCIKCRTEH